jgi:hypothetical protein
MLDKMETVLPGLGTVNAGGFIVGSVVSACLLAAAAYTLAHGFSALYGGAASPRKS